MTATTKYAPWAAEDNKQQPHPVPRRLTSADFFLICP
jgi:hypothetical protein